MGHMGRLYDLIDISKNKLVQKNSEQPMKENSNRGVSTIENKDGYLPEEIE
jgi:hypothetical protein